MDANDKRHFCMNVKRMAKKQGLTLGAIFVSDEESASSYHDPQWFFDHTSVLPTISEALVLAVSRIAGDKDLDPLEIIHDEVFKSLANLNRDAEERRTERDRQIEDARHSRELNRRDQNKPRRDAE